MSKIIFNEHQIRQLELNPNVASVSDRSIQYTGDFKVRAVLENQEGKGPFQIFEEVGFDLTVIGRVKAKSALERWRKNLSNPWHRGTVDRPSREIERRRRASEAG